MYYPKSFFKLLLLAFVLVSLPLFYAVAEMAFSLDRLAGQGRLAVYQAGQAGRLARQLQDQTTQLERIVRQYLITEDSSYLENYGPERKEFQATAQQLLALPLDSPSRVSIEAMLDREIRLAQRVRLINFPTPPGDDLAEAYATLTDQATKVQAASNDLVDAEVERLRQFAGDAQQSMLWHTLAAVPVALALAVLLSIIIARPIRQLAQAIRQMGQAKFDQPVSVTGPRDLRFLGQQLDWLRDRLRNLEEEKTKFLRHVSHELKTPLTAVREGAELLRDNVGGSLSPEQQEIVRIIRDNTLQLQKLIEDLLRFQQAGAVTHDELTSVKLADVIHLVIHEHKLAMFSRGITVQAKLREMTVQGNEGKLRTIVDNLISNAIKYSPRWGTIRVELRAEEEGNKAWAILDVIDQGPGILADDRSHIFDTFYQGQIKPEGRVGGTGLGLAIVRDYVSAHRGTIDLLTDEGELAGRKKGAHFRVRLPIEGPVRSKRAEPAQGATPE